MTNESYTPLLPIPAHLRKFDWYAPHLAWARLEGYAIPHDPGDAPAKRAVLDGENLRGEDLRHANLRHVDFRFADLQGAYLRHADLQDANLQDANLRHANLRHANLRHANFRFANLQDANLQDANLQDTDLRDSNLADTNLDGACLDGASMLGTSLRSASLRRASLVGAALDGACLDGASMDGASLRGACLDGASLVRAVLDGAVMDRASLRSAWVSGVSLVGATGLPQAPVIENIDAQILEAIWREGCELNMKDWHTCATTHCRAGWAIVLAGDEGRALEKRYGSAVAGALIYAASRPDKPIPDFITSNDAAMADIRACAAEQMAQYTEEQRSALERAAKGDRR